MFDELIERYGARLFALCMKLARDREDARDLYQESWLRAYRAYKRSYREGEDFMKWLTAICVNVYRDTLRRKRIVSFADFENSDEKTRMLEALPAPESEDMSDVRAAVDALPERYRTAVLLYYFFGADTAETASVLKIPEGTVKSRLSAARKILRRELADYGKA